MPTYYTWSYSHTYIEITYRCHLLNVVLLAHIYRNPMS
ncbi:hypothetical protein F383_07092 [Gossypium arboreum]|uniref:Uncharacterized protein n=1 Tax=Gossypium arboreum TaxID=29729 RepID=A0A0B0NSB4_GOSAR|nr:hypothetical protein F383_07092 [Gossypium arboreum]